MMAVKRVKLVQYQCPNKHCILALAYLEEDDATARRLLNEKVEECRLDPWCALCRAPRVEWRLIMFETGFTDMRVIMPALMDMSLRQLLLRAAVLEKFECEKN